MTVEHFASRLIRPWGLLLLGLCACGASPLAQDVAAPSDPTAAGRGLPPPPPLIAPDPSAAPRRAVPSDPVVDYLQAIERAETLGGAWAIELVDLYHGMGQSLLESGELDEARDAFHRAAMVARVNNGPYSLEQADYLYSIADIEFRVGNPEAATEALEHIYRINARVHGEDDPAMLPAVEQIYTWYAERLVSDGARIRSADLQNLSQLMERIAFLTEQSYGLGTTRTALSYRAAGQAHYRAIFHMVMSGNAPDPEHVIETGDDSGPVSPDRVLVDHLIRGEEALRRSVEAWQANPDATALEVAEALAQLGDWNLALDYERSAKLNYEQAYQVLSASDEVGFMAAEYLGSPTPLRFMNSPRPFVRNLDPPTGEGSLEIAMTVTDEGRVRDLQVRRVDDLVPEEQLQTLTEQLGIARFRPAVVDGQVQTLEGYVWKSALEVD